MRCAALIPDCHVPYEDKKCFNSMLLALQDLYAAGNLTEIVVLGDFGEVQTVSSHAKHPKAPTLLIDEVDKINERLDLIDALFPDIKKVFIEGNHEFRLARYLQNNAPALFGITSIEHLFQFNQRPKWLFVPYSKRQMYSVMNTDLYARHEPFSMSSAKASLTKCQTSLVYGHIHRVEEFWHTTLDGRRLVNFSLGWLGDERYNEVFGYAFPNWQKAFGLVYSPEKSKNFTIQKVYFDDKKRCILNGKTYEA